MPGPDDVNPAIARGLSFLSSSQEADGSFISYSSASMRPFRRLRTWQTTFVPALMLASLSGLDNPAALGIRHKLAAFLLTQKDDNWAFNYWSRSAPEFRDMPYPNDLDDTFCALAALYLHDPSLIDGAALAKAVKLLLATETAVGGPYRTWLVPPDSAPIWTDIDPAVNSNIAYFLRLVSNPLPKLDGLMGDAIAADMYVSPYYPSEYAFIYYFARAYNGPQRDRLLRKVRRLQAAADSNLDLALCLAARVRLGDTQGLEPTAAALLAGQRRDGSWGASGFYADPVKNGRLYYNGAPALSTAFILEALQLYRDHADGQRSGVIPNDQTAASEASILAAARKQCRTLPPDLRRSTLASLRKIAASSQGSEIINLAERTNRSLLRPLEKPPANFIEQLGLANLYGWTAYTIYDDFLDETGKPGLLPAANVALRNSLQCFSAALPEHKAFQQEVLRTFDTIDGANAWELAQCRYTPRHGRLVIGTLPDYGDLAKLAERSLGHTLAPLAVLYAAGVNETAIAHTRRVLAQYLIVRQLNDDLHDWQEDLEKGHITYVVARILGGLRIQRGSHNIDELISRASPYFWHHTLPAICREMQRHVDAGRRALQKAAIFKEVNVIGELLDEMETSIADTLDKQRDAKDFLKQYRQKT